MTSVFKMEKIPLKWILYFISLADLEAQPEQMICDSKNFPFSVYSELTVVCVCVCVCLSVVSNFCACHGATNYSPGLLIAYYCPLS